MNEKEVREDLDGMFKNSGWNVININSVIGNGFITGYIQVQVKTQKLQEVVANVYGYDSIMMMCIAEKNSTKVPSICAKCHYTKRVEIDDINMCPNCKTDLIPFDKVENNV